MKKNLLISAALIFLLAQYLSAQNPVVALAQKKPVILTGGKIHTGTGDVIEKGILAFDKGRITFVGRSEDFKGNISSYDQFDVTGKDVYPGLIFPGTSLGLVEIGSGVEVASDDRETGELNPNVRVIVAYNTDSHVIPFIRSNGILLAQIVPTGSLLPGTASVVQLDAWNWEDAAYAPDNGIMMGWPRKALPGGREGAYLRYFAALAGNYDRSVEELEKIFSDAVAYNGIEKPESFNPRLAALKGLFDGSKILYIAAPGPKEIIASVSFARKYGVKKIVLTDADESAWSLKDFLKENNVAVIVSNPFSLPKYDYSDIKLPFELPALFLKEGILTGITYSNQAYGNLPFAAGQAVAYGLTREEALQTITLNNARILGIDDRTGSLENGKDANIIVSTGDILDMSTNNVELAFIMGRNISLDNKHKQLYRRFQAKYENMK